MYPFRFSLMTVNLWNTELWELRSSTVKKFLDSYRSDICCFQELRPQTIEDLDRFLSDYDRISDSLPGWTNEGNIYYRRTLFEEMEHGAISLEMPEIDRRLFWVRLQIIGTNTTLVIANVHLTHQENSDECSTGYSYRHNQAIRMGMELDTLVDDNERVIVCGDFNDPIHPSRQLRERGFHDTFHFLGIAQEPTFPCAVMTQEIHVTQAIDKILFRGKLCPVLASVPHFYHNHTGISDHWSVISVFSLEGCDVE